MRQVVSYPSGEALLALYQRLGPVINAGFGSRGYVRLFGADANKFVFSNGDAFSWRETLRSWSRSTGRRR